MKINMSSWPVAKLFCNHLQLLRLASQKGYHLQSSTFVFHKNLLKENMNPFSIIHLCLFLLAPKALAISDSELQTRSNGEMGCGIFEVDLHCQIADTVDASGRYILEALLLAMKTSNLDNSTTYSVDPTTGFAENIICVGRSHGISFDATVGAGLGYGPVSAGASITKNFTIPSLDTGGNILVPIICFFLLIMNTSGICVFPEGYPNKTQADTVTLGHAKDLLAKLLNTSECHACAQIPLRYPNVTDGSGPDGGGLLRIDYRDGDNCIDKCIGPDSFKAATTSSAIPTGTNVAAASGSFVKPNEGEQFSVPRFFMGWIVLGLSLIYLY